MKIQPTDHNLELAAAMLAETEEYLLSQEVFWPLERRAPFPRLTIGALLLTLDQLEAARTEMTAGQDAGLQRLTMQMDLLRAKHAVALERKAAEEARSRLNLWRAFVSDLEETPARAGSYAYEVRHRVMLARLAELASDRQTATESASALDSRLRRLFAPGEFIWELRLQQTYPPEQYWFLYGHPRREE